MNILTEVTRHLEALTTVRDFSQKPDLKRRTFRQGDYLFVGTRWAKLAFRLGPRLEWSDAAWRALHEIARGHGLEVVVGNAVHLKQRRWLRRREIASIHDVGMENDITVNPKYPRAAELLQDLGAALFGASGDGPLETVEQE